MKRLAIDPAKLYSTREIAELAGNSDDKAIARISILLKRHDIGRIYARNRLVEGTRVAEALELIARARSGNPEWIEVGEKSAKKAKRKL
jgi:hypothetical protein